MYVKKINNHRIIALTPQTRRYTTLLNINVRKNKTWNMYYDSR